jgi:hypothetical protein
MDVEAMTPWRAVTPKERNKEGKKERKKEF